MTAEQIEKAIEKIRPKHCDINGWIVVEYKDLEIIRNTIGKLADENKRLKENKNKAIEILEQDKASASFNTAERIALNILNGSDEK